MVISSEVEIMDKYIGFTTQALKVLEVAEDSLQIKSHKQYKVQCLKCGKIFYRDIQSIKNFKGSGCLKCTSRYSVKSKPNEWHLQVHYINHAKSRNLDWDLSYEDFYNLVHQNCYYCNAEPNYYKMLERYSKNSPQTKINGVDRIDSSRGYSLNNCVSCCPLCNRLKSDLDQNVFIDHINKIHNFQNVQRLVKT